MFAALGAAGSAPGIEALSTNGELYLFNPATADLAPLPPYLPGIQNLTPTRAPTPGGRFVVR